ncbi:MAG: response regulator [Deltaproteobacteria bacterium]|nr:MAG: response regulator [Deltaproteobacteria bacterium]
MSQILIIDDDEQIQEMLQQIFEQEGFDVAVASDGRAGIRLHRKKPADLVITDIIMPDQEGIETIQKFREEFPDVRIIAMSGGGIVGPSSYLRLAKKFGAMHTFTKPIDMKDLLDVVRKSLA